MERALVERARAGDGAALEELLSAARDAAVRYATSILHDAVAAEDAVQEALAVAGMSLPSLRNADSFDAWLRGIVRFQCYRDLRRRHATLVSLDHALQLPGTHPDPLSEAERRDRAERVAQAVDALPASQRTVARLYYFEDLSHAEIAACLDLPVSTVNNRLYGARQKLKGGLVSMVSEEAGRGIGVVTAARGPVFDVQFRDEEPRLMTAVEFDDAGGHGEASAAVAQLPGGGLARCVALLDRRQPAVGSRVRATGAPTVTPIRPRAAAAAVGVLSEPPPQLRLVETGVKPVDLFAPLAAGGRLGLWGDIGAGKVVLLMELLHNLEGQPLSIFDMVLAGHGVTVALSGSLEPPRSMRPAVAYLPVDNPPDTSTPTYAAVAPLMDAVVFMSHARGREGLWPALDPLRSSSKLLGTGAVSQRHSALASEARELVRAYEDLRVRVHPDDVRGLPGEEREIWTRGERLSAFLTQPFAVAQAFTKLPGQRVPLEETLAGVESILRGEYDAVPAEVLYFGGSGAGAAERGRG